MSIFTKTPAIVVVKNSVKATNLATQAVNLFTTAIGTLNKSTSFAESTVLDNDAAVAKLSEETSAMKKLVITNTAIVSNINKLLEGNV